MKIILTILMLVGATLVFGQESASVTVGDDVQAIVKDMEQYKVVTGYSSGITGQVSEQYQLFIRLREKATTEELIELTNHENALVKCYAFWALKAHKDVDRNVLLEKHYDDDRKITFLHGCIGTATTVYELMQRLRFEPLIDKLQEKENDTKSSAAKRIC